MEHIDRVVYYLLPIISEVMRIPKEYIIRPSRTKVVIDNDQKINITPAKYMLCYILKHKYGYTLQEIANIFPGSKDHTTIRAGLLRFEEDFKYNVGNLRNKYKTIIINIDFDNSTDIIIIAKTITYLSTKLGEPVSIRLIEDLDTFLKQNNT